MVYCDYIKNDDKTVTYAYGGDVNDISGELVFHFDKDTIEIVKLPETDNAPERHIMSLYGMHMDNFKKGIFKQKICYEC